MQTDSRPLFAERILHFINHTLPGLDRRGRAWEPVGLDTPLFADGRLDSLSILHLLTFLEDLIGAPIPDALVVMRHFQTAATIAETFGSPSPLQR